MNDIARLIASALVFVGILYLVFYTGYAIVFGATTELNFLAIIALFLIATRQEWKND